MKTLRKKSRVLLFIFFLLTALFWLGMDSEAFARAGGGRSSGSSGFGSSKSYSRPSTPPSQPQAPPQQVQPPVPPAGAGRGFLSGMAGGIMGGLLGGMLFSSLGFAGSGTGGGGFGFGDLLLIMAILGIIYFVVKRFRSRNTMQMSTAGAGSYSYPAPTPVPGYAPPALEASTEEPKLEGLRHIREMDSSFSEKSFKDLSEDIFFKIQGAWTKRDLGNVRNLLSPEMLSVFQQDVNRMLAEKRINRLENIAMREVEIVEAGQDRGAEVITARFYANLLDYTTDDKTTQVISGSTSDPVKFVEYWTFSRNVGEKNWVLAGITQENNR
jgi:predicted lipid-binding transport protein (Tim44 family)